MVVAPEFGGAGATVVAPPEFGTVVGATFIVAPEFREGAKCGEVEVVKGVLVPELYKVVSGTEFVAPDCGELAVALVVGGSEYGKVAGDTLLLFPEFCTVVGET